MAELFELSPLAAAASDLEQLARVIAVRGTPDPEAWPGFSAGEALPDLHKVLLPIVRPPPLLRTFVPNASPAALDLLERMLAWDPSRRVTAAEVRWWSRVCNLLPAFIAHGG